MRIGYNGGMKMTMARLAGWALVMATSVGLGACATGEAGSANRFDEAAVAADHRVASEAGAQILRQGGNAVDAAVATSFVLSVVRPESCGIGGGGFMVIHFSEGGQRQMEARGLWPAGQKRDVALNYREMAPGAVGPDYFEALPADASVFGGKAVGVPGTVAGLLFALERYGTLSRATVLAPAIRAAEKGFAVDAHYAKSVKDLQTKFEKEPAARDAYRFVWERFLKEGSVKVGDRITLPEQAAALRLISERGAAAFYDGPIAEAVLEAVARAGGAMNAEDLKGFKVAAVDPLRFEYAGRTFLTMPPPSSGGVAMAETLGILSQVMVAPPKPPSFQSTVPQLREGINGAYRLSPEVKAYRDGPLYLHALTESFKNAFADRSRWLGDPAYVDVPVARLTSAEYATELAKRFDLKKTLKPDDYGSLEEPGSDKHAAKEDHGTSHFSVVDRWGSAVACTETINLEFGSLVAVEKFGFVLNNQLDDFTTKRGKPNEFGLIQGDRNLPAPGKRPLSSMTPTIVLDDTGWVEVVTGASGGPRIITATTQCILNVLVFRDPPIPAVVRGRLHHQWSPDVLRMEQGLYDAPAGAKRGASTVADEMRALGHVVELPKSDAAVQMIVNGGGPGTRGGGWLTACDPRKGGAPAGISRGIGTGSGE